jgi:hypothetical protein
MRKMGIKYIGKEDIMVFIIQILPAKPSTLAFHNPSRF